MIAQVLEFLVQGLHLGADRPALNQVLGPLGHEPGRAERPLRVLALGGHLGRPLQDAGYEVYEELPTRGTTLNGEARSAEPSEGGGASAEPPLIDRPDVVCSTQAPADLPKALAEWAALVRPGGMVLLVTRRGHPTRARLGAAFLHAGLREPVQQVAGISVLTAGRVSSRQAPPAPFGAA